MDVNNNLYGTRPFENALGNRIRDLREKRGESQADMAAALNLNQRATIEQWEKGTRLIKAEQLAEIAKHLGVSADFLLGLTDIETPETDLRAVCEFVGLSSSAIDKIRDHQDNPSISAILAMDEFWKLIYCICAVDGELKHLQTRIDQNDIDYSKEPEPDRDMRLRRFDATEALSLLIDEFSGYQEAQKSFGKLIWENFHQRKAKE